MSYKKLSYKNPLIQNDLSNIYDHQNDWEKLRSKTVLITGATGMLASYFSFMLMYLNDLHDMNIRILLLVRNRDKAYQIFGEDSLVDFVVQDVCDKITINEKIDFIIHAAGFSSPYYILKDPVGIIKANTIGTLNIMDLAGEKKVEKVLFTSTREVYGNIGDLEYINESQIGITDPLDYRSCYPESKRMAETILKSYSLQYGISFNTVRIAHSYGPGMQLSDDGRVMSDFISDGVNKKDIILNSDGQAERAFCYVSDAVSAMFLVLLKGTDNEAYNIANESEPVKLIDLAKLIGTLSQVNIKINNNNFDSKGYCSYKRAALDVNKLNSLGWAPQIKLETGLKNTLMFFS